MKFQVKALRDSFNVVSVVLDAADEADAERQAKSSGLAVLSLKRAASGTIRGQTTFYFARAGVAASIIQNVEFSRHLQHQPRQAMFHHHGRLGSPPC